MLKQMMTCVITVGKFDWCRSNRITDKEKVTATKNVQKVHTSFKEKKMYQWGSLKKIIFSPL